MKKTYIAPDYQVVVIKTNGNLLLAVSSTEAKGGESNFSREVDFGFDGE